MDKIKTFFAGVLAALLAAIYFFSQSKPQPKDPFEDEQNNLAAALEELNDNPVEAEELSAEEVKDYWGKK